MGEEFKRQHGESSGIVKAEPERAGSTGSKGSSTASTASTGTGAGTGAGTGTGEERKKEFSELAILTDAEKEEYKTADEETRKKIIKRAKARERYRQNKGQGKPKKVKKKEEPAPDTSQLNLIIAGISSAVASRPGCAHWLLTESEIESITTPLARMMQESDVFAKMGAYSNQIALVTACVTVFAPRILITAQQTKEKKKIERTGNKTDTNVRDIGEKKTGNSKSNRTDERKPSADDKNNGESVPFYGVPIC